MKICFKKKTKPNKTTPKKFLYRESNPEPSTCKVKAFSTAQRQPVLIKIVQLIILNIFAHKILRWTLVELYL